MNGNSPILDRKHFLLFLLVTLLMGAAGTHLLESFAFSFGLTRVLPYFAPASQSVSQDHLSTGFWELAYRFLVAPVLLVLGYNCLSMKEWARYWLVWVLTLDLGIWIVSSFYRAVFGGNWIEPSRLAVQLMTIVLEVSLFFLLTHPEVKKQFVKPAERSRIS